MRTERSAVTAPPQSPGDAPADCVPIISLLDPLPWDPMSRSLLDERFRQILGRSPIRYLTEWRMHLAEEHLATTEIGVAVIAERVGYDSEVAFSRAFKRTHGLSPSYWRAERSPATPPGSTS